MQVHSVIWRAFEKCVAGHDHARDPEEKYLRRGDEDVGRIERLQVACLLVRPAERRQRPEPRREPGVEHVLVLSHRPVAVRTTDHIVPGDYDMLRRIAVVAVPDGNAVSPPELP